MRRKKWKLSKVNYAKREDFDDLKQLFDDTAANVTRVEEGLKDEIVALRGETNAVEGRINETAAQTSEEKTKVLENELENEVNTRMNLETEIEELRHANAQSAEPARSLNARKRKTRQ